MRRRWTKLTTARSRAHAEACAVAATLPSRPSIVPSSSVNRLAPANSGNAYVSPADPTAPSENQPPAALSQCVANQMAKAVFERTKTGGSFSYPIVFAK